MSIRKNPIAYLALFIALGGTSYAAVALPADSVGTPQLRNGAVTSSKIRKHSIVANALAPGVIPAPEAHVGLRTVTVYGPVDPPACPGGGCPTSPAGTTIGLPAVVCPQGTQVLGGGYTIANNEIAIASAPTSQGEGWAVTVEFTQPHMYTGMDIVSAICGSVS